MGSAIRNTSHRWSIENTDIRACFNKADHFTYQMLPDEMGKGYTKIYKIDEDLDYLETQYTPSKDIDIISRTDNSDTRMMVTLSLQGQSQFLGDRGDEISFKAGHVSIAAFTSSIGKRQYYADKSITQLRFSIGRVWLDKYFGENCIMPRYNHSGHQLLGYRPISTQGLQVAKQLLTLDVREELKRIFLHSYAMSILASELAPFFEQNGNGLLKGDPKELEIVKAAQDIIAKEYRTPPSVAELAKRVGTNQLRLKQLFHNYLHNTPYKMLLETRMNKAYELLLANNNQVEAVSDMVGYCHASSFCCAFTKHFGVSPKQVTKRRA